MRKDQSITTAISVTGKVRNCISDQFPSQFVNKAQWQHGIWVMMMMMKMMQGCKVTSPQSNCLIGLHIQQTVICSYCQGVRSIPNFSMWCIWMDAYIFHANLASCRELLCNLAANSRIQMLADDTILFLQAVLFCSGMCTIDYTVVYNWTDSPCMYTLFTKAQWVHTITLKLVNKAQHSIIVAG